MVGRLRERRGREREGAGNKVDGELGRTVSVRAGELVVRGGEVDGTGSVWVGWEAGVDASSTKDARNDGSHGAKNDGDGARARCSWRRGRLSFAASKGIEAGVEATRRTEAS